MMTSHNDHYRISTKGEVDAPAIVICILYSGPLIVLIYPIQSKGHRTHSQPEVDRIWDIWGSYYHIPKAIFYQLKETIHL